MQFPTSIAVVVTLACTATATLRPALSNSKYKRPITNCMVVKSDPDVQAAECGINTRTHDPQTFAVFTVDPSKNGNNGAPYGTCDAFTCPPPTQFVYDPNRWIFFWSKIGEGSGPGTGCIRDPKTNRCGCEYSTGQFVPDSNSCV